MEEHRAGHPNAAMGEYREAMRIKPDSADAHNNLGVALLSTGQIAAAVGQYREAVELKPEFTEARYNLCLGLELLGQLDEALSNCRVAATQKPGDTGIAGTVERLKATLDLR